MEEDTGACRHQPVYFGVVNINIDERTIGSVDVWRCGACKKRFCEEKQLGIEELADLVGMPKIASGEKWAVLVCRLQKGKHKWRLARLPREGEVAHECLGERAVRVPVRDFRADDADHWSFLIDDNVNKAVEI